MLFLFGEQIMKLKVNFLNELKFSVIDQSDMKLESLVEKDVFFGFCRLILVKCKYVFKGYIIIVDVVNRCLDVVYGIVFNNYFK